jgi:hypothetical protein
MEHAIHLFVSHFIDDITLTSRAQLARKLKAAAKKLEAHALSLTDLDALKNEIAVAMHTDKTDDSELDDALDFSIADALGKAMALITQVLFVVSYSGGVTNTRKVQKSPQV